MSYTENELKEATQIAYLSFLKKAYTNLKADGIKGPIAIRELIMSYINSDIAKKSAELLGIAEHEMTFKDIIKHSDLKESDKNIIDKLSKEMLDWKIIDIHDTQPINGFYGCCIETSDQEAIVSFRGSEDMKKISNLINDWCRADFALLNSRSTRQQEEAEKYCDEIIEKGLLEKYKKIAVTGHSLGGNLATHFTINAAIEKRKTLFDKINQSINFDGPGVSDEYIKAHSNKIKIASPKLTHLKWSAVGDLLFDIPNEHCEYLSINEELYKDNPRERIRYKMITRHNTNSLVFNEDGTAKRGKQDFVSKGLSVISKTLDKFIPERLTNELYAATDWIFDKILRIKDGGRIDFKKENWSKRHAEKGSILGICVNFIEKGINVLKEEALTLQGEINELFALGGNNYNPKVAFADVLGAANADYGFNMTSFNTAMRNYSIFNKDVDKDR